eukprot:2787312-Amphidinium_carterae.1
MEHIISFGPQWSGGEILLMMRSCHYRNAAPCRHHRVPRQDLELQFADCASPLHLLGVVGFAPLVSHVHLLPKGTGPEILREDHACVAAVLLVLHAFLLVLCVCFDELHAIGGMQALPHLRLLRAKTRHVALSFQPRRRSAPSFSCAKLPK